MVFRSRFFHPALVALATMILALGCSKSKSSTATSEASTAKISGKVTYTRIPTRVDAEGKVLGLETDASKFQVLPARGVTVRLLATQEQKDQSGTTIHVWTELERNTTSDQGTYSFTARPKIGEKALVEVISIANPSGLSIGSEGRYLRLVADPKGINSPLNQADRLLYAYRKGVAGTVSSTDPALGDPVTADATVNIEIGTDVRWWLVQDLPWKMMDGSLESMATGSRVLGILDSMAKFALVGGDPLPGGTLDLHYVRGRSEARGSFVEFDTSVYPQAYNNGTAHFFGSLRGGPENDDAWDEGVIFPLLARNRMFVSYKWLQRPVVFTNPADIGNGDEFTGLAPDVALYHALADALAANMLKTPYFADITAAAVVHRDIRDTKGAPADAFSAPNLRALSWELILKANNLSSPGTKADWDKIDPNAMMRYFKPTEPKDSSGVRTDLVTIWSQLATLQVDKITSEPIDLKAIFNDATLMALVKPFGIVWPRPTATPLGWLTDWGTDFPVATGATIFNKVLEFDMNTAHRDGTGFFPGLSKGERYVATVKSSKDQAYFLNVAPLPPAGSTLEVRIGSVTRTIEPGTSLDPYDITKRLAITGNSTSPLTYDVVIRFKSPDKAQNYRCTLSLLPPK